VDGDAGGARWRSGGAGHEPDRVPVLAGEHRLGAIRVATTPQPAELADQRLPIKAVDALSFERRAVAVGAHMPMHFQRVEAAAEKLTLEVRRRPGLRLGHGV